MEQNKITDGSIPKQLLMFFWPIWMGTFFQQLYNTADAVIVGNYIGKEALASVGGPTSAIINLLVGFVIGTSSGASVIIAQYYGAGNLEKTKQSINTAIAFAVVGGIILTLIGIPLSPVLLQWMNTPAELMQHSTSYIQIYFAGVVFNLIYNIGSSILRAMGDSKRPLYFLIVCSICNVVLDIIFVVVFKMGVDGVAYATIISQAVSAVLVIVSLKLNYPQLEFSAKNIRVNVPLLKNMLKIGIPTGLQSVMYALSNIIIQSDINSFGTNSVAAWTAYGKLDAVFWMTISSFGIAITTFVGQNYGAKKHDRVKQSIKICMNMTAAASIVLSVVLMLTATYLFRIFSGDKDVILIGVRMLFLIAPFYITYVPIEILSGAMRGVGDVVIPTLLTLFGICALRVAWSFIAVPLNPTIETVCFSYPVTWIITSVLFLIYYKKGKWLKVE